MIIMLNPHKFQLQHNNQDWCFTEQSFQFHKPIKANHTKNYQSEQKDYINITNKTVSGIQKQQKYELGFKNQKAKRQTWNEPEKNRENYRQYRRSHEHQIRIPFHFFWFFAPLVLAKAEGFLREILFWNKQRSE